MHFIIHDKRSVSGNVLYNVGECAEAMVQLRFIFTELGIPAATSKKKNLYSFM